jgi:hypothetical protein
LVAGAGSPRIGRAQPPDVEVVYRYDKADDCFGYALNLD